MRELEDIAEDYIKNNTDCREEMQNSLNSRHWWRKAKPGDNVFWNNGNCTEIGIFGGYSDIDKVKIFVVCTGGYIQLPYHKVSLGKPTIELTLEDKTTQLLHRLVKMNKGGNEYCPESGKTIGELWDDAIDILKRGDHEKSTK